jgi:1,4-alpha-glucan branching enzyme
MPKQEKKSKIQRRRVVFTLIAPAAKRVAVLGDFNKWSAKAHAMKKDENGVWHKNAMLPEGRYEYRFLVDGEWWNDPVNDRVCWNCFGTQNNLLEVSSK